MPYIFFIPLAWWAMHDETLLLAFWLFAWGVLPTVLHLVYQNPVVKLLVDTTWAFVQMLDGKKPEVPHVWMLLMEGITAQQEIALVRQQRIERGLTRSRMRHA